MPSEGWTGSKMDLIMAGKETGELGEFNCLGSCILTGGRISIEVYSHILKA